MNIILLIIIVNISGIIYPKNEILFILPCIFTISSYLYYIIFIIIYNLFDILKINN